MDSWATVENILHQINQFMTGGEDEPSHDSFGDHLVSMIPAFLTILAIVLLKLAWMAWNYFRNQTSGNGQNNTDYQERNYADSDQDQEDPTPNFKVESPDSNQSGENDQPQTADEAKNLDVNEKTLETERKMSWKEVKPSDGNPRFRATKAF